jgi:hypothetical protein
LNAYDDEAHTMVTIRFSCSKTKHISFVLNSYIKMANRYFVSYS